jgi:hypothetical protein
MFPPRGTIHGEIKCEFGHHSLKEQFQELMMAGMNLLVQAQQIVDRMSLLTVLISFCFCLIATSLVYVLIWKQSAHHLDLVLGKNCLAFTDDCSIY